jgi:D-alanyl-D-alanine carboxypeptidase
LNAPRSPRSSKATRALVLVGVLVALALAGVGLQAVIRASAQDQAAVTPTRAPTLTRVQLPDTAAATHTPPAPTVTPPATATPTPTETPLPAATQTALFLAEPCAHYDQVPADLLVHVDRETGLARDYEPADLATVALADDNVLYRSIQLRRGAHQPLLDLLAAMNAAELKPLVISGYRSYSEQTLAFEKWQQLYPDRAPAISAQPGHSEHQLGTAVDFSTAEMVELYGDFFNVRFSRTAEGQWLLEHAVEYGFTLSYPAEAVEETGYAWEPWHYRYVGDLAAELLARSMTLTAYLRECGQP